MSGLQRTRIMHKRIERIKPHMNLKVIVKHPMHGYVRVTRKKVGGKLKNVYRRYDKYNRLTNLVRGRAHSMHASGTKSKVSHQRISHKGSKRNVAKSISQILSGRGISEI